MGYKCIEQRWWVYQYVKTQDFFTRAIHLCPTRSSVVDQRYRAASRLLPTLQTWNHVHFLLNPWTKRRLFNTKREAVTMCLLWSLFPINEKTETLLWTHHYFECFVLSFRSKYSTVNESLSHRVSSQITFTLFTSQNDKGFTCSSGAGPSLNVSAFWLAVSQHDQSERASEGSECFKSEETLQRLLQKRFH